MPRVLLCVLVLVLLAGCGGNPTAPPAYIKDVHLQQEGGDGVLIYFTLADSSGAYTAADGRVLLRLEETPFDKPTRPVLSQIYDVTAQDFTPTKVGQGAFEHEVLLWSTGRIPYSKFDAQPAGGSGKLDLTFIDAKTGTRIQGSDTVVLP